jgi:hypothetical protein
MVFKKLGQEEAKERKVKREEVKGIQSITDLATHIPYNSTVKLIITANKLWATNAPDKNGRYSYGISLKVLQIEAFIPENKSSFIKNSFSTDAFIDEEDDDDVVQVAPKVQQVQQVQVPVQTRAPVQLKAVAGKSAPKDNSDDSDDDSDGDGDGDSSSEETIVPQKVQSKTSSSKQPVKGKVQTKVKTSSS